MYRIFQFFLLVCFYATFAQVDWTLRNPLPQGNHLNSVIYGNGQYVAVGFEGAILTSEAVTFVEKYHIHYV